ncbi:MAG: nuclear transport factor 2 family protein [Bdellovibrionia bacterium]
MKHPNALLLEKLYSDFVKNDFTSFIAACPEEIAFQIPGNSKLGGKYDKKTFISDFIPKLKDLSAGSYKLEVHDVLASDRHAVVLASSSISHSGKTIELRTVHVWRFENGKPVAFYEYPRDLYQFDLVWA